LIALPKSNRSNSRAWNTRSNVYTLWPLFDSIASDAPRSRYAVLYTSLSGANQRGQSPTDAKSARTSSFISRSGEIPPWLAATRSRLARTAELPMSGPSSRIHSSVSGFVAVHGAVSGKPYPSARSSARPLAESRIDAEPFSRIVISSSFSTQAARPMSKAEAATISTFMESSFHLHLQDTSRSCP
jgi:hypothetical protein